MDILVESPLTIHQACQVLPRGRNNAQPRFTTVWRWIIRGAKAPDGTLVKLEAVRLGSKWVTSRQAIARFIDRLTPAHEEAPSPVHPPAARKRAAEQAALALKERGI